MKASSILSTLAMAFLVGSAPTQSFNIQQIQAVQPTANQQIPLAGKVENNPVIQNSQPNVAVSAKVEATSGDSKVVDGKIVEGDGKSSKYINPYMMGMMNPYMNMMYGGMGMMGMMNPYLGMGMGY
jgi:hypothetical protein